MPGLRRAVVAAAAIHLAIAALFCTHIAVERALPAPVLRALAFYAGLTGVPTHFNFFAPIVSTQARGDFILTMADGSSRHASLATGSAEANQRLAMMFTFTGDARTRAYLMRAWSVYFLTRHPEARSVEARIELLDVPSIAQARRGGKPAWVELERMVTRREDVSGR